MNKLALVATLSFLSLVAFALAAPGCADVCDDLSARCGQCADADYQTACETIVNRKNQGLCAAELDTFELFCNKTDVGGGGSGPTGPCIDGQGQCEGQCVDLQANHDYCGNCLIACDATQVCAAGECAASCPAALPTDCNGGCVDTDSDPLNCGACGNSCLADPANPQVCSQGTCVDMCDPQSSAPTLCGAACVDLSASAAHCGQCFNGCAAGELCSAGSCASMCGSGLTDCGGSCSDTTSDPQNCGSCGNVCVAPTDKCSQSGCVAQCAAGETDCGGSCIDTDDDPFNCGGCGNVCVNGTVCSGGACLSGCPTGTTDCGGQCVDTLTDAGNCGACGNNCATAPNGPKICSLGSCVLSCTSGLTQCGDSCHDIQTDPKACGASCLDCTANANGNTKCQQGACVAACTAPHTDCSGACVDLSVDNVVNCGSCGNNCGDGSVCTADSCAAGMCQNVSGGQSCSDGNECTQDMCDPIAGCMSVPYTQSELEALCVQLESYNLNDGCVYCQPQGALCNQTMGINQACIAAPSTAMCGTCQLVANMPATCDTTLPLPCPP